MNDKTKDENNEDPTESKVIAFEQSRTQPKGSKGKFKDLGLSKLSQKYGENQAGLKGHWCSRCKGIWYGFASECECPQCGNRNG